MTGDTYGPNRDVLVSIEKAAQRAGLKGSGHRLGTAIGRAFEDQAVPLAGRDSRVNVIRVHGSCTVPVIVPYQSTIDKEYHVRCRRCASCLGARQHLWRMRAELETMMAPRTVFFTGTFAHQSHDYEECKDETTLFLKRLRWHASERDQELRYLIIPERHKSGAWHIHALAHVDFGFDKELLRRCWDAGFSWPKWADKGSAGYVTKYIAKDLMEHHEERNPRIRASRAPTYGGFVIKRDADVVRELLAKKEENLEAIWTRNLKSILKHAESEKSRGNFLDELVALDYRKPELV